VPAPQALTRVLDELLWSLRRGGITIATSQAIDVARVATAVGLDDRGAFKEALASVVVVRAADRIRYDQLFDRFFASGGGGGSLWDRLSSRGFDARELGELRGLLARISASGGDRLEHLGALLQRGAELDRLLYLVAGARALEGVNRLQLGFATHQVLARLGVARAHQELSAIRVRLREALGDERGNLLTDALRSELDRAAEQARVHVAETFERRDADLARRQSSKSLDTMPFASLSDAELDEVRRAVRRLAQRLRGGARVRTRHSRRGRIDPHRTLRRSLRTSGVPFSPARRSRVRDKPRLLLACDVSDSVRAVARFMLEFVYATQELFQNARSFVFVSELGETTRLFANEPVDVALAQAYSGAVVSVADNSNYGRVLRIFEQEYLRAIDRRTTVVILGDGRTNYHEDGADVLDRIRVRARALLWLCPESRAEWQVGDSAMNRYAPRCTQVLEVRCARDLETAARALIAR
jgi:uncharacterized protein